MGAPLAEQVGVCEIDIDQWVHMTAWKPLSMARKLYPTIWVWSLIASASPASWLSPGSIGSRWGVRHPVHSTGSGLPVTVPTMPQMLLMSLAVVGLSPGSG